MKTPKLMAALLLTGGMFAMSSPVQASAVEYFDCKLSDGVTIEQLVAASGPMLKVARENGVGDYKLHFLVPLYSDNISKHSFIWVGESPNATKLGAFNDFYVAAANKKSLEQFYQLTKDCDRAGVDWKFETKADQ